jgi:hypothetical protein
MRCSPLALIAADAKRFGRPFRVFFFPQNLHSLFRVIGEQYGSGFIKPFTDVHLAIGDVRATKTGREFRGAGARSEG